MSTIDADAVIHLIKQAARAEVGEIETLAIGYSSDYDDTTHSVQVVIPSFRVKGPNGEKQPYVSDWMPLGTDWAGAGYGDQVAPGETDATPENPGAGDQVLVLMIGNQTGFSAAGCFFFNAVNQPPGGVDPGERIMKSKGGKSWKIGNNALVGNGGSTPAAVEGSKVDLTTLIQAINTACTGVTGYVPILVPPTPGAPTAAIASGQGAQDVLFPAAGGS